MKYRSPEKDHTFGDDYKTDRSVEHDEGCNKFYNRKQRTKDNKLASDCEAEYAPEDRDAEVSNYKSDRDAGPMNYKRWDRYGGR